MLITLDSQKRVAIGKLLKGISATLFNAKVVNGNILLEPMQAIPEREAWLYKNPQALKSVAEGLKDAAEGKITEFDPDQE